MAVNAKLVSKEKREKGFTLSEEASPSFEHFGVGDGDLPGRLDPFAGVGEASVGADAPSFAPRLRRVGLRRAGAATSPEAVGLGPSPRVFVER